MGSNGTSGQRDGSTAIADRHEETRRAMLAKCGLVAGGAGIAAAIGARDALATHVPGTQPEPRDFDGYFNIKHYGAIEAPTGDPATNLASIHACLADAAGKGVVYIPPGVFETSDSLFVPNNTIIRGVGPQSVIKDVKADQAAIRGAGTGAIASNVVVEHIKIDRTQGTALSSARCVYFPAGSERIFIRHVECVGALTPLTPPGSTMKSGPGITVAGRFSAVVHCYVHHCGKDGISCYGPVTPTESTPVVTDMVIANNLIVECGDDHIAIGNAVKRVAIVGNICNAGASPTADIKQAGAAIALRNFPSEIEITGNVLRGGRRAAIHLDAAGFGDMKDIQITNNVIVEAGNGGWLDPFPTVGGGSAVHLYAANAGHERVSIKDNFISAPRYHGVYLQVADSGTGTIRDVTIANNQIWINPSASYLQSGGSGVACQMPSRDVTDVRIAGNTIRSTTGPGIYITGQDVNGTLTTRRFAIDGNRVADAGGGDQIGITLDRIDDLRLTGNTAHGQDTGLVLLNPRGTVIVTDNDLTGNSIGASCSADPAVLDYLNIRDNPGFNPWTSEALWTGGWSPGPPYTVEVPVGFSPPFPAGKPPQVLCTVKNIDAYAVAKDVTNTGFKLRVVSTVNPTTTERASWTAEPSA